MNTGSISLKRAPALRAMTVIVFLGLFIQIGCNGGGASQATGQGTNTLEEVLKSGTIRCGYVIYPPGLTKDPNTGAIGGIFPDVLAEVSQSLGVKLEWVEEVGWGTMIEGLEADRYDMICSPVWANASRGKRASFTKPLFYSGIGVYVRQDDHRFDAAYDQLLNDSRLKLAAVDGEMSDIIAQADFPSAQRVSLPQMSDVSQVLLNITTGKADATFVEPYIAGRFLASNPNSVRNIAEQQPIRIFPNTMMLKKGDYQFQEAINIAIDEAINAGMVDRIVKKYSSRPDEFYAVARPFR